MPRASRTKPRDSRAAILGAARAEFADRGFAGAGVDRVAAKARVNKAMVYYHFGSKLALYRAVLAEEFDAVTDAARRAVDPEAPTFAQLDAYLRALIDVTTARPHIVPIFLREIAAGGRNLDADAMVKMTGLFQVVHGMLGRGEAAGDLRAVHPLMTHFVMFGSAMLYQANEPIRVRVRQLRIPGGPRDVPLGPEPFLAYMNSLLRRAIGARPEDSTHA
jgi:TetR/AcrR family transcriptional regulator